MPTQTDRVRRPAAVLSVLAVAILAAAAVALLAWWASAGPPTPGRPPAGRFVAFAFATLGLALLAAPLAPAGRFDWPALFRWAAVVDTAGLALLIGSLIAPQLTWREGLALYALLAAFAAAQLAALWLLVRLHAAPGPAAAAAVALAAAACTSLLWGHLLSRPFRPTSSADSAVLAVVRYANPLLAADDAINPPTRFDWRHEGRMYARYGIIGESRTWPLPHWPAAAALYALAAAALGLLGLAVGRRRRAGTSSPADGSTAKI